ncbi:MAG: tRNA uridine-5-carboxymethylaminomethyl(34) synthesis GTPase MnmE [Bacteroidota bacterium]
MSYSRQDFSQTIVALATPAGSGALGIIRLSGPEAIAITNRVFRGKDLSKQATQTLHYGHIHDEEDRLIDEVMVSLFRAPRSYTGEEVIEISCHGSDYIIQQLIQLMLREGARLAQPGEFTMRAFLNGKMDLSQAEAVADLIASQSESAHRIALQQMRGGFSRDIQQLRQQLIDFASLIELELDFGEEDVEFANRDDLRQLVNTIQGLLRQLIESFQLGNAIKNGISTVIAGRPNAGKSTLLNALLKEDRAIVSDIAGTTRDTIEEPLVIQGVTFRLIDTAGIRDAQDQIEAIGVEKTLEKIRQSTVLLYVFDILDTPPEEVQADIAKLRQDGLHILIVANKMDLNPYNPPEAYYNDNIRPEQFITASAIHQMNIPYLTEKLYDTAIAHHLNEATTVVSNARHYDALRQAQERLAAVRTGLSTRLTGDLLAMDIRQALYHLGEITGEVSAEDLLGNIFGRFCIGK